MRENRSEYAAHHYVAMALEAKTLARQGRCVSPRHQRPRTLRQWVRNFLGL